jgi:hypothetical protein
MTSDSACDAVFWPAPILAISAAASAAPREEVFQAPQPTTRNYALPGSMP